MRPADYGDEIGGGFPVPGGSGEDVDSTASPPVSRRRWVVGAALFAVLTAGGIALVARFSGDSGTGAGGPSLAAAVSGARPWLLIAAVGLALAELVLGGTRLWVLARRLRPGFRWRHALHAHLYNFFFSGVTPLQAGGGPAQYYVLRRSGLEASGTVAVLTATWVGVTTGYAVLGAAAVAWLVGTTGLALEGLGRAVLLTFLLAAGGGVAFVLFPDRLERILLGRGWRTRPGRRRRIVRGIARYRKAIRGFAREGRAAWLGNAGLSWSMLLVRCGVGVVILAALRVEAGALSAVARQVVQFALITVSPSPGGSGVAELTALGFMTALVPAALLTAYAVLWRAATSWVGILVGGGYVAADQLRRRGLGGAPAPGADASVTEPASA